MKSIQLVLAIMHIMYSTVIQLAQSIGFPVAALVIGAVIFVMLMTCIIKELFKPYWKKTKQYSNDSKEERALLA